MSLVISKNLVLAKQLTERKKQALICYNNIVSFNNVTATSSSLMNPITNLANPATAHKWKANSSATQTITIAGTGAPVDYLAFANHNLAQVGLTVEIRFNGATVLTPQAITDTQAVLFLFNEAIPTTIELIISGATTAPIISVLYIGKSLALQRNIYVGHTPISYGRQRNTINGLSENGQYLGEIVVSQSNSTSVSLQNLTPGWYRQNLDPFFAASPRSPCFFAWRSEDYPLEIGYCWTEGDPRPENQSSNGMMSISWNFRGIA